MLVSSSVRVCTAALKDHDLSEHASLIPLLLECGTQPFQRSSFLQTSQVPAGIEGGLLGWNPLRAYHHKVL